MIALVLRPRNPILCSVLFCDSVLFCLFLLGGVYTALHRMNVVKRFEKAFLRVADVSCALQLTQTESTVYQTSPAAVRL